MKPKHLLVLFAGLTATTKHLPAYPDILAPQGKLGVIEKAGYQGWIGCDYEPSTATTNQSFGWMKKWDPSIG